MATQKSAWGIEIGQCALKALKLSEIEGQVQVDAFEIIEHSRALSAPDADRRTLVRDALNQFLSSQNVRGSALVVGMPGQSSFTRFVKLPPVEKKKVPDIVRFEAEQQIPFPIDEVIWQWQTFEDPDSPDVEVGIFAIKRGDVGEMLDGFSDAGMNVDAVQMAPLSLYNFMTFDGQTAEEGATLLADVGAEKTDLVVADGPRIWTRTIQIGGNSFTEALVRAFKLSFEKAEKLKRSAATSKYARQVFQAMRPVFADLVQEVQRSIGYYTSLHRETRFKKLVGLGNGFRLPGLQKFLEQNLNIPVARIDSYNNIDISDQVNAPHFTENVLSFAVAYGLAVQGLERARVGTNLLPAEIVRRRQWNKKRPWFAAAAAVLLACLGGPISRHNVDADTLDAGAPMLQKAQLLTRQMERIFVEASKPIGGVANKEQLRIRAMGPFAYRTFWPALQSVIFESVESVATDQPKLVQYARNLQLFQKAEVKLNEAKAARAPKEEQDKLEAAAKAIRAEVDRFEKTQRGQRKIIAVEGWRAEYHDNVAIAALFETGKGKRGSGWDESEGPQWAPESPRKGVVQVKGPRGFVVQVIARSHMTQDNQVFPIILTPMKNKIAALCRQADEFSLIGDPAVKLLATAKDKKGRSTRGRRGAAVGELPVDLTPGIMDSRLRPGRDARAAGEGPEDPDPLLPKEDMSKDTRFMIAWRIAVKDVATSLKPKEKPKTPAKKSRRKRTSRKK